MQASELLTRALTFSETGVLQLIWDMHDACMVQPTPRGGNHTMWVMGHLAFIEGAMTKVVTGDTNPVEHLAPLFAPGSEPLTDAAAYPPFADVVQTFRDGRARNMKLLTSIGNDRLSQTPPSVPQGFEEAMKTIGDAFMLLPLHQMVHYGQIADCRRAAGRKPLM